MRALLVALVSVLRCACYALGWWGLLKLLEKPRAVPIAIGLGVLTLALSLMWEDFPLRHRRHPTTGPTTDPGHEERRRAWEIHQRHRDKINRGD